MRRAAEKTLQERSVIEGTEVAPATQGEASSLGPGRSLHTESTLGPAQRTLVCLKLNMWPEAAGGTPPLLPQTTLRRALQSIFEPQPLKHMHAGVIKEILKFPCSWTQLLGSLGSYPVAFTTFNMTRQNSKPGPVSAPSTQCSLAFKVSK